MPTVIRVVYEDDKVVVFDKPSGLLTVPTPKKERNTLEHRVNEQFFSSGDVLFPCHRLDRETSGAILFAKGKTSLDWMTDAFRQHRVSKKYVAFVRGRPKSLSGEIRFPIKDFHARHFSGKRSSPMKSALTRYRVLETFEQFSVVEVEPVTGRTNQIRIHFAKIGHPLLGERLYAFGKDFQIKFHRVALHSRELTWPDPKTGKKIHVTCELAEDMKKFWGEH